MPRTSARKARKVTAILQPPAFHVPAGNHSGISNRLGLFPQSYANDKQKLEEALRRIGESIALYQGLLKSPPPTWAQLRVLLEPVARASKGLLNELLPARPAVPDSLKAILRPRPFDLPGKLNEYAEIFILGQLPQLQQVGQAVTDLAYAIDRLMAEIGQKEKRGGTGPYEHDPLAVLVSHLRKIFFDVASEEQKEKRGAETEFVVRCLAIARIQHSRDIRRSSAWLKPHQRCPWKLSKTFQQFLSQ